RLDFDRGGGAEGRNRGGELYGRVFPGKPNEPKGDERQGNNDYEKTVQHLLIEVLRGDNSSALDAVISAKNPGEGLGINTMLFGENARREGFHRILIEDRDRGLKKNGASIEVLIDEMDRAARDLHAMNERLMLGIEAREGRKERGVDIEDPVRKL